MTITLPQFTLVIGGAASGKSLFAERLVAATGRPLAYVATAEAHDEEMRLKIAAHQARRNADWHTIEAPRDLGAAMEAAEDRVVLIDCFTLWLTNLILAEEDLVNAETRALREIAAASGPVVGVTNEVGAGIVPENALARRFRGAQGRLNQTLAARAGLVVTVMAGLPLVLKGQMPEGFQ
ncbi:bifunctional adenosylcobinamide kinase/adenosylcobinamide-phosphate guanylyltransferase [Maritimibacter sp. DP1N21-5]|uniref:bifunctional adenosylcobinamide kinase/adenosylcobinamide-phosphate guanylyltransferase n=1 Tax=Maritimibacter sp. DP1N21-5 TaxID=2836867 RepID=UPI001C458655|nr:bifunctional adenosylcobinamide kinase/adenosylcobinamide-phosphate guanylyltransferase [Maritimibacter sp. DP1N21-5]MBV7408589.1 bifunctional adenosylcobinamide kinase/adenosylcobinamide-phosphate guanylyltransferase [Maritimibacter sp. DP1N21-5]